LDITTPKTNWGRFGFPPTTAMALRARIETELARDPSKHSIHLAEGLYRIELTPLRVLFEVDEADKIVQVVSVRLV
jgi:hypothetical protein